ncbi:MAG: HAMP domain-containing sensor histidine kinase [Actinomycetota bacterium]
MRRSYALRLTAAFAGVGIAAAALTALLVNVAFDSHFTGYIERQRHTREQQLVAALADSYRRMGGWNAEDLDTVAPLALMDAGTMRLEQASGGVIWEASEDLLGSHMAKMHRAMMGSGELGPERRLPIEIDGSAVGIAVVRLPRPGLLPADVTFRSSINRLLLLGGIGAGLAALLLGMLLARRATAPARALSRAARALAGGDRSHRVAYDVEDEFGDMAQAFNRMADTIEEEDRLRRAFAADVAHELRTPLAIMRSEIEAIQDRVVSPTPPRIESLHEEVLRLTRLVGDLETLARADAAGFSLERRRLALGPLVQDALREFAGAFEARRIEVESQLADIEADADPARIHQITANLLSNALKFTPEGGKVRVDLAMDGRWATLIVSDTGAGIPADEQPRVFDRFFRGSGVRVGGSGIGLTVVRELVRAHAGEVEVRSAPGKGTVFTVRIPLAS